MGIKERACQKVVKMFNPNIHVTTHELLVEMAEEQRKIDTEEVYELVLDLFGRDGLDRFKESWKFEL